MTIRTLFRELDPQNKLKLQVMEIIEKAHIRVVYERLQQPQNLGLLFRKKIKLP
jgi:hypothetical protein